jgi:hypothetical protein
MHLAIPIHSHSSQLATVSKLVPSSAVSGPPEVALRRGPGGTLKSWETLRLIAHRVRRSTCDRARPAREAL